MNDLAVILEILEAWNEDRLSTREIVETLGQDRSLTLFQTTTQTDN